MKCPSTLHFHVCELEAGHTTRHKDGHFVWLDHLVSEARVAARAVKTEPTGTVQEVLDLISGVNSMCSWKTEDRQKAIWLDGILRKYQETKRV